ncbi:aminopeptidase Y [Diaporthe helianthi]|uniref:Peptide hydrolase n=1 Tax=Diaporthe helianthi TaxID=158607 RepID=A0A2P5HZZ8_DIAHE|nr:aminopeptidase Y [Diaporthe helianthi]
MAVSRLLCLASLATTSLHAVSAYSDQLQQPLFDDAQQAALTQADKPLVDSEALQDSISIDRLVKSAQDLYDIANLSSHEYNRPTRVIGSEGHLATLEYIRKSISELGDYYEILEQPFPAYVGWVEEFRLVIGNDFYEAAQPMSLTPPTKDREPVRGDLVLVSDRGCSAEDYPSEVKGNIAFISRGTCSFGAKSAQAGKAGAIAAVIYNNEKGELSGTLGEPDDNHVATFGIPLVDAEPILKKLDDGEKVDAIAYISAWVNTSITRNIVIQTAQGDPDNCVALGAHSDSVEAGPGINDDGSGTLSLLEVARQLSKFKVNNCVRFAWWSAEEEGLVGSSYYASKLPRDENLKVRLFMDYDMLASPNFAYQVYNATNDAHPVGSEELRDLYVDWYESHNLNYTFIPFDGRSDYDGFIRAGIPAGGIATGAEVIKTKKERELFGGKAGEAFDECYHQLCDDTGNVNVTAWELNTKLVAHSVATYAASFEGFPKRDPDAFSASSLKASTYAETVKYRGDHLFI